MMYLGLATSHGQYFSSGIICVSESIPLTVVRSVAEQRIRKAMDAQGYAVSATPETELIAVRG